MATPTQYFDPAYLRSLGTFIQPTTRGVTRDSAYAGTVSSKGGNVTTTKNAPMGGLLGGAVLTGGLDPVGGALAQKIPGISSLLQNIPLIGSLFGSTDTSFKPYINEQGQYVWTNPNVANPVPVANVPGATLKPSKTQKKLSQNVQGLVDVMPYINQMIQEGTTQQTVNDAMLKLGISQQTSPAYAQLMVDLYNQYGPQLNAIGNAITEQNALANQGTVNKLLTGPGKTSVEEAVKLQNIVDQPLIGARNAAMDRINQLYGAIDLTGALSPTERDEITKGLARQNLVAGTYGSPSQLNTVANAQMYGNKAYERKQQAISNFGEAVNKSIAVTPAFKSNQDAFQIATGKMGMSNPGSANFTGITGTNMADTSGQFGLAGSILGGMNQMNIAQLETDTQKQLAKKDWADYLGQVTGAIGNITGVAGKLI